MKTIRYISNTFDGDKDKICWLVTYVAMLLVSLVYFSLIDRYNTIIPRVIELQTRQKPVSPLHLL